MRLPRWPRRFLPRRKRRKDVARQRLMEPVRLSFRRLEERRVLDANAAFTAAGELILAMGNQVRTILACHNPNPNPNNPNPNPGPWGSRSTQTTRSRCRWRLRSGWAVSTSARSWQERSRPIASRM